jgi:hypothetical protein
VREYRGYGGGYGRPWDLRIPKDHGSLRILKKLFLGEWDDEFLIALPGSNSKWSSS